MLSSHGFDINGLGADGDTLLWRATTNPALDSQYWSILLEYGARLFDKSSDGRSILRNAITATTNSESSGCIPWLLSQGVDANAREIDRLGSLRPLHIACWTEARGAARILLEYSRDTIDVSSDAGPRPLHIACARNSPAMVQLLLDYDADATALDHEGRTPLETAVIYRCTTVLSYLMNRGIDVWNRKRSPPRPLLHYAANGTGPDSARLSQRLLQYPEMRRAEVINWSDEEQWSVLASAVMYEQDAFVLDLFSAGVHIEAPHDHKSAWIQLIEDVKRIHYYRERNKHQMDRYGNIVRAFVQHYKKLGYLESRNADGDTLLATACSMQNIGATSVLLEHGADPNSRRDYQRTSVLASAVSGALAQRLRVAASRTNENRDIWSRKWELNAESDIRHITELLLSYGAEVDFVDEDGFTTLHLFIMTPSISADLALLLLGRGAPANIPTVQPLHMALEPEAYAKAAGIWEAAAPDLPEYQDRSREKVMAIVKELIILGVPLDSFGMEGGNVLHEDV